MNRKKKIIINLIIIVSILFGYFYYLNGFYISKQKCITDTLKVFYKEATYMPIATLEKGNIEYNLLADTNNTEFIIIGLIKYGPFYKSNSINDEFIDPDKNASLIYDNNNDMGFISLVYRTSKDIAYVKYTFGGKDEFICNQWYGNYTYLNYPDYNYLKYAFYDKYPIFKCEAFDSNGNLIDVIH